MRDVCCYWIDNFGIDGIRLDAALYYYSPGDKRGLPQLIADIRGHVADPNFSLTMEFLDLSAAGVANQVGRDQLLEQRTVRPNLRLPLAGVD